MNATINIIEKLKWSLLKLKMIHILTILEKLMIEIPNLKMVILLEYQNTKTFFSKGYTPNWSEEASVIKEVKHTFP